MKVYVVDFWYDTGSHRTLGIYASQENAEACAKQADETVKHMTNDAMHGEASVMEKPVIDGPLTNAGPNVIVYDGLHHQDEQFGIYEDTTYDDDENYIPQKYIDLENYGTQPIYAGNVIITDSNDEVIALLDKGALVNYD